MIEVSEAELDDIMHMIADPPLSTIARIEVLAKSKVLTWVNTDVCVEKQLLQRHDTLRPCGGESAARLDCRHLTGSPTPAIMRIGSQHAVTPESLNRITSLLHKYTTAKGRCSLQRELHHIGASHKAR